MMTAVLAMTALGVSLVHANSSNSYSIGGNTPGWVKNAQSPRTRRFRADY
jgi:hypothetical protein